MIEVLIANPIPIPSGLVVKNALNIIGLIATTVPGVALHRDLIITLAARHKLPTVYYARFYVAAGGLISYGPDYVDQYRQAAGYVDRILKGENRPTCRCRRPPSTKW